MEADNIIHAANGGLEIYRSRKQWKKLYYCDLCK